MPSWLHGYPLWVIFLALYASGFLRGQATYWIARAASGMASQGWSRVGRLVGVGHDARTTGAGYGRRLVRRFGLAAVPLCYLTVGVQSLVLAAAGVLRIRWLRFTLAQMVGVLAWATIYTTIGWALWEATFAHAARSGWALSAAIVAMGVVATSTWLLRRRRSGHSRSLPPVVSAASSPSHASAPAVEVR